MGAGWPEGARARVCEGEERMKFRINFVFPREGGGGRGGGEGNIG